MVLWPLGVMARRASVVTARWVDVIDAYLRFRPFVLRFEDSN